MVSLTSYATSTSLTNIEISGLATVCRTFGNGEQLFGDDEWFPSASRFFEHLACLFNIGYQCPRFERTSNK